MTHEGLYNDMVAAMKAPDKVRKAVISTMIADVKKAAIDAGTRDGICEALVDQVILKSKKDRQGAAGQLSGRARGAEGRVSVQLRRNQRICAEDDVR